MSNKIFDLESGKFFTIQTGHANCPKCGKEAWDLIYQALSTDEYRKFDDVMKRKFIFVGRSPLCDCTTYIWLSNT